MAKDTDGATPIGERMAVSVDEAASIVGTSRSSIYIEIKTKRLAVVKAGRRTLVPMSALREWLTKLPSAA